MKMRILLTRRNLATEDDVKSPYQERPDWSYWRNGMVECPPGVPPNLYRKKWSITREDRIATAGSCFAQHIGRNLRKHGLGVIDVEPPPRFLAPSRHMEFGYSMYSARYGNVYTVRQMLQLVREAYGLWTPSNAIWTKDGRFFDALRPSVDPAGLSSVEEVRAHRVQHLGKVREMIEMMDVFIFTFGLTECWLDRASGTAFPTAPGTIAGSYESATFTFKNFNFFEVYDDFRQLRSLIREIQGSSRIRFLLTVSPVPLTASASEQHVLSATVYSKSVLRGVAGLLASEEYDIDYFPSYEIISNPWSKDLLYERNLRSVSERGVGMVMSTFAAAHFGEPVGPSPLHSSPSDSSRQPTASGSNEDSMVACDEALLEAFGRPAT